MSIRQFLYDASFHHHQFHFFLRIILFSTLSSTPQSVKKGINMIPVIDMMLGINILLCMIMIPGMNMMLSMKMMLGMNIILCMSMMLGIRY